MKSLLGGALLLMLSGGVFANELADAERLLNTKDYTKALPIYQRLAASGNAEAQLRLGEMYWFGDGTPAELARLRNGSRNRQRPEMAMLRPAWRA